MSEHPNSSNRRRREELRRRQQAQAATQRRIKTIVRAVWIAGILAIAVVIGVTVWAVGNARSNTAVASTGPLITPAAASDAGAIRFGSADATVTVTVYADFMCPFCGRFERANGESLRSAVAAGTITLDIHPMSFLDSESAGARYSTRAANAFVTIAETDPDAALRFNQLLFANQPTEGSTGLSDQQLATFATQAGAPSAVVATFGEQRFVPWIEKITQQAFDFGITGTPTVRINGQAFTGDLYTPGPLTRAIQQAASGA